MTGTTRIQPAPISGVFGVIVKRFSKKMLGEVPEPLGVYFHNRPVLKAFSPSAASHRSGAPATRT